ncbi:hypothetical protein U1Q18_012934 [Sarracenia purpurea var. burkii]
MTSCYVFYQPVLEKERRGDYLGKTLQVTSNQCHSLRLYDNYPSLLKSVFAVGMICCDEGRLKEKPVLLQSSAEQSGGQRVRLDLQKLSLFSIFPGQVVGVEGHNPSGHYLIASKIVDYIPLSVSSDEHLHPTKKQAVNLDFQSTDPSHVLVELSMVCPHSSLAQFWSQSPFLSVHEQLSKSINKVLPFFLVDSLSLRSPANPRDKSATTFRNMNLVKAVGHLLTNAEILTPKC